MKKEEWKLSTHYKSSKDLNGNTPSTGRVVCYDGEHISNNEVDIEKFVEIQDCRHKIRLHKAYYDSEQDWIDKIKTLRDELTNYINHLANKQNGEEESNRENPIPLP